MHLRGIVAVVGVVEEAEMRPDGTADLESKLVGRSQNVVLGILELVDSAQFIVVVGSIRYRTETALMGDDLQPRTVANRLHGLADIAQFDARILLGREVGVEDFCWADGEHLGTQPRGIACDLRLRNDGDAKHHDAQGYFSTVFHSPNRLN